MVVIVKSATSNLLLNVANMMLYIQTTVWHNV